MATSAFSDAPWLSALALPAQARIAIAVDAAGRWKCEVCVLLNQNDSASGCIEHRGAAVQRPDAGGCPKWSSFRRRLTQKPSSVALDAPTFQRKGQETIPAKRLPTFESPPVCWCFHGILTWFGRVGGRQVQAMNAEIVADRWCCQWRSVFWVRSIFSDRWDAQHALTRLPYATGT
ncbi:hypothetical protein CKO51_29125 [Rhodopirellula sp. SM50]|nr:hypothetical protein CKO51_29125 [Rhodopirellula sp. SM50]